MPSKELIEKVARDIAIGIYEDTPSRVMAEELLSTILAALQEPTEAVRIAYYNDSGNFEDDWRAMLAASALGEQSE